MDKIIQIETHPDYVYHGPMPDISDKLVSELVNMDREECYGCKEFFEIDKTYCCQDEIEVMHDNGMDILGNISGDGRTRCEKCRSDYVDDEIESFLDDDDVQDQIEKINKLDREEQSK